MCAGQGRDLTGVLSDHSRRTDVQARLVELDERNVKAARRGVAELGLTGIDVVRADAGRSNAYIGAVPAEVVLACGVFGNLTDNDVMRTVEALPKLCAPQATVIWTRHRQPPDLTPAIRAWFEQAGFAEQSFDAPLDTFYGVGVHRFAGDSVPLQPDQHIFNFVGYDGLRVPGE